MSSSSFSYGSSGGSSGGSVGYSSNFGGYQPYANVNNTPVIYGSSELTQPYTETNYVPMNTGYPPYTAPSYGNGTVVPAYDRGYESPRPENVQPSEDNSATLIRVRVPAEARIYVNDKRTTSTGEFREFVARKLVPGKAYTFPVKAVIERDGQVIERQEIVSVRGGEEASVAFNFEMPAERFTAIEVNLPENAKLTLAGNDSNRTGSKRVFSTRQLQEGESWDDYKIVATIEKDGETITQEKTLTVVAGEVYKVNFDFDGGDVRVASK